jgi:hypothetical protein
MIGTDASVCAINVMVSISTGLVTKQKILSMNETFLSPSAVRKELNNYYHHHYQ